MGIFECCKNCNKITWNVNRGYKTSILKVIGVELGNGEISKMEKDEADKEEDE